MVDRDKVIKGLECCAEDNTCDACPYCQDRYNQDRYNANGPCALVRDAIELLKAQEPRVMTLEEMREDEVYWFDCLGNFVLRPVICNMYDRGDSSYLNFVWQYGNFSWKICEYGRTWRCWTSRPSDEQRRKTPWEKG